MGREGWVGERIVEEEGMVGIHWKERCGWNRGMAKKRGLVGRKG